MNYLQRLNVCNTESKCRIKINLICMYKILRNLICISLGNNIKLTVISNIRGNMYKQYKCNFFEFKKCIFLYLIINVFNSLPKSVIC